MNLPQVGQPLDAGVFAGVTTHNGKHYAVVLLPGKVTDLTWDAAMQWAAEQGGMLPTRAIAAMLFANVKSVRPGTGHQTNTAPTTPGVATSSTDASSPTARALRARLLPSSFWRLKIAMQ